MPSIVRRGFLKPATKNPGTGEADGVRCGSAHAAGIYSPPSAEFSLTYTHSTHQPPKPSEFFGRKLIVRSATQAPAHVANRELEYIVFDSARIIPVFVIHIDRGGENAGHFEGLPVDRAQCAPTKKKPHPSLLQDAYRGEEVKDKSNLDSWSWVKAGEEENVPRDAKVSADIAVKINPRKEVLPKIYS
ncbi:hypothetical protein DL771_002353 [Monosporascus sp. 5C6A]|nr:hypothetical protein DL771_002353 [Monosporascus sp. 5C6A]